ncbi:hypothetical protein N7510_009556 [Penicillium lagena]|uniref:uncharacterized protein n=1 Tax=Penicillium lagena TaxID=94218 RepID=UPI0025400311|nr:uncharacterized protein N7510_009556 [Penicillium lagena]KAJ5604402.1 hypothetical protein N7510_009556 [Penicillium lagena]
MSVGYDSEATIINATWVAALLSERDVAGQIPINFIPSPAVTLSAACFGNRIYDEKAAAKCISNLLAVGYRRLILDIYWSVERRKWTFCPVIVPARADVEVPPDSSPTPVVAKSPSITSDAKEAPATGYDDSHGDTVYELGKYRCTDNLDLYTLAEVLVEYFQSTTTDLEVYTTYLVLNLHVAASDSAPNEPASAISGDQLPSSQSERAGSYLEETLREFLYSPAELAQDRSNLNESWYEVDQSYMPITEYYTLHEDELGQQSTPDGWPSSKYIQLAKRDRVLIEYGTVDPQLSAYDLSQDEDFVFPSGYLTSGVAISESQNGSVPSGCLYHAGAVEVSQANSSWALSSHLPVIQSSSTENTMDALTNTISDITACGISPILNTTLFNETADTNVAHYRNVSLSAGWAWAIGEPRGAAYAGGENAPQIDRCAIMDMSLQGRWRATNCSDVLRAACRVNHSPFSWTLSDSTASYSNIASSCPSGSVFSVPRTGLENTYLYETLISEHGTAINPTSTDPTVRDIYVDFNSINVESCWVSGGPGAACPYAADPQELERRTVLVAAVAGIVILIITALTLFIKCNANRRNSRRRKRVIEGWEYEGIPS